MKRVVLSALSCVALIAGLLALGAGSPASADSVSVPFQGTKLLNGKCNKPGTYRIVRTVDRAPTESDRDWLYVDETHDAAGFFKTYIYVKNSYRDQEVGVVCNGDRVKYRITTPITYVHKTKYVNFNCAGMSCRHLFTKINGWSTGYCMRGSDGKVCTFDD
jgi:hypothetical protein